MASATADKTIWSLDGNLARLNCDHLSGHIDAARPDIGLHTTFDDGPRLHATLLGVHRVVEAGTTGSIDRGSDSAQWPLPLSDVYLRGNDLVASYGPALDWPFSPQIYWEAGALRSVEGVLASLSLLVSFQTHLLDTFPRIAVRTQLPPGELFLLSANGSEQPHVDPIERDQKISQAGEMCCVFSRFKDASLSYVEIVTPNDYHEITLRPEGDGLLIDWRLFSEFLEKGVIRRARVHAALVPRENDVATAAECCKAVKRLELPLTT